MLPGNVELSKIIHQVTMIGGGFMPSMERGENNPTYETLKRLANGLGITVEQLIHEEEPQLRFDAAMNKLIAYAASLTPEERMDLADIAKVFRRRKKRN